MYQLLCITAEQAGAVAGLPGAPCEFTLVVPTRYDVRIGDRVIVAVSNERAAFIVRRINQVRPIADPDTFRS